MSESASVAKVYEELKALRRDILEVRYALLPEVKISDKERKEMHKTIKEMRSGKEKSFFEMTK